MQRCMIPIGKEVDQGPARAGQDRPWGLPPHIPNRVIRLLG